MDELWVEVDVFWKGLLDLFLVDFRVGKLGRII